MLLPAWVSISTVHPKNLIHRQVRELIVSQTLTVLYHLAHRSINIKKETSASIGVFSIASFISLCTLLFQLHLTRENDPVVPLFSILQNVWQHLLVRVVGFLPDQRPCVNPN